MEELRIEKLKTSSATKEGRNADAWAHKLLEQGLIGREDFEESIKKNNSKEAEMEKRKLPQLKHYGFFGSVDEIRKKIQPKEGEKFVIRCTPKDTKGERKHLLDATLTEVCAFAENTEELPGGFEKWNVEVKEFVPTISAGTIIVSPSGKTTIETWHGPHYMGAKNTPVYRADFDPDQFHMHYEWKAPEGAQDLPKMQNYAMKAMGYVFPHLRPRANEQIYIEYGVREDGQIFFIEANDSNVATRNYTLQKTDSAENRSGNISKIIEEQKRKKKKDSELGSMHQEF